MTSPVSAIQAQVASPQPIGAYSLNGSNDFRAGHFVVNPPPIPRYSINKEIYVDQNFYKELTNPRSKAFYSSNLFQPQETKPQSRNKSFLKGAAFAAGVFLAYVYRANIKTFLAGTFEKIKNMVKNNMFEKNS